MKKFLLPLFAMSALALPALAQEADYGATPETAVPLSPMGWFVPDLADAPAEAWFTYSHNSKTPVLWGVVPDAPVLSDRQLYVYLCDGGSEAFQYVEGSDSYVLLPGQEYLIKITPKAPGFFCDMPGTPFPPSKEGTAKYYPIDMRNSVGAAVKVTPGTTTWYLYDFNYPSSLQIKDIADPMGALMTGISDIQAIHIECPGGTNSGDLFNPPYVKAGKNVIGLTFDEDTKVESVLITLDAFTALSCSNNLLRGKSLAINEKNTYPDAYYTVDRFFKVPEDGTYTFTNHGAKGTILNIGKVILPDPANQNKGECDWSDIKSATVGENDAVVVVEGLKKDEIVIVQSDAFGIIGQGLANSPYLLVEAGNTSSVDGIAAEAESIVASVNGGILKVKSVLLAAGAEVAVYDMAARKVASSVAPAGSSEFNMPINVVPGTYAVVVYGKGNSETVKVVVK